MCLWRPTGQVEWMYYRRSHGTPRIVFRCCFQDEFPTLRLTGTVIGHAGVRNAVRRSQHCAENRHREQQSGCRAVRQPWLFQPIAKTWENSWGGQPFPLSFDLPPPPQTVWKVSARAEKSVPLYRGDYEFSILTGGTFTFRTVSPIRINNGN